MNLDAIRACLNETFKNERKDYEELLAFLKQAAEEKDRLAFFEIALALQRLGPASPPGLDLAGRQREAESILIADATV